MRVIRTTTSGTGPTKYITRSVSTTKTPKIKIAKPKPLKAYKPKKSKKW